MKFCDLTKSQSSTLRTFKKLTSNRYLINNLTCILYLYKILNCNYLNCNLIRSGIRLKSVYKWYIRMFRLWETENIITYVYSFCIDNDSLEEHFGTDLGSTTNARQVHIASHVASCQVIDLTAVCYPSVAVPSSCSSAASPIVPFSFALRFAYWRSLWDVGYDPEEPVTWLSLEHTIDRRSRERRKSASRNAIRQNISRCFLITNLHGEDWRGWENSFEKKNSVEKPYFQIVTAMDWWNVERRPDVSDRT